MINENELIELYGEEFYKKYFNEENTNSLNKLIDKNYNDKLDRNNIINLKSLMMATIKETKERDDINQVSNGNESFKTLVSFVSFAKEEPYDLSTTKKTMEIFQSIEEVYLLHSKQTKENAEKLKEDLLKTYSKRLKKDLIVKLQEVSTENYEEAYQSLFTLLNDSENNRDEFIFDITQGIKMVSMAFSRFAIEQGVRTVTWQSKQYETKEKKDPIRLPGTETLYFNKDPQKINYKSYININEYLRNYDFKEISKIYEALNNQELSNLYNLLSQIYNYDFITKLNLTYLELKDKFKFISKKLDEKFLTGLKIIKNILSNLDPENSFLTKTQRNKLLNYIFLDFFIKRYNYNSDLLEGILKIQENDKYLELENINYSKIYEAIDNGLFINTTNMTKFELEEHLIEDKEELISILEISDDGDDDKLISLINQYDFYNLFSHKIADDISLDNGMLSINSKGLINLDLSKLIASKKRNSIVIEALINQNEYTLEKDSYLKGENSETLEKFIIKDNVTNRPVNLSRFTKDIDKLNNLVKEKTEKRGKKIEKLFTFDKGTCRLSINLD